MVVDDSAVMRKLISNLLARDSEIEVIATAIDGDFALSKIDQLRPDVVTLDVEMPRMDGLTTLERIVTQYRLPVVMLSSFTVGGAAATMQALEMGAVDFVCKPKVASQIGSMADELISKVKAAARSDVAALNLRLGNSMNKKAKPPMLAVPPDQAQILAIGASSGGPHALRFLLPRLPVDFAAPILIVQHLPEAFTRMLARWLDEMCAIEVKEATAGELAMAGRAYIAPAKAHMKVNKVTGGAEIQLERGTLVNGHMPSVDVLFNSVAESFGASATAVILTGMGSDGATGLGEIRRAGGHTIAQDQESCSVFGMPRVAIQKGSAKHVLALDDIAPHLISRIGRNGIAEKSYA
ncbi:MAG: two-component system, chemotaxis family, protein-glutamate methylesterase/glutaminase [Blastocatellia bacterium]